MQGSGSSAVCQFRVVLRVEDLRGFEPLMMVLACRDFLRDDERS